MSLTLYMQNLEIRIKLLTKGLLQRNSENGTCGVSYARSNLLKTGRRIFFFANVQGINWYFFIINMKGRES